jgi:hypothetical protein
MNRDMFDEAAEDQAVEDQAAGDKAAGDCVWQKKKQGTDKPGGKSSTKSTHLIFLLTNLLSIC